MVQNTGDIPPILSYAVHEGIGHDVNCHLQLVADTAVKTPEDVTRVDAEGVFDTLKVNLFKAGSVYKALQLVKAAKAVKWRIIVGTEEHCNETNDDFIVIASKGGAPKHPGWYHNLMSQDEVTVQVINDIFQARTRIAKGDEREIIWNQMVEIYPPYSDYQDKTEREIPVVILEKIS